MKDSTTSGHGFFSENQRRIIRHADGIEFGRYSFRLGNLPANIKSDLSLIYGLLCFMLYYLKMVSADQVEVDVSFRDPNNTSNYKFSYLGDSEGHSFFDDIGQQLQSGLCGANATGFQSEAVSIFTNIDSWEIDEGTARLFQQLGSLANQVFTDCLRQNITSAVEQYNDSKINPHLTLLKYIFGIGGGCMILFGFPAMMFLLKRCVKGNRIEGHDHDIEKGGEVEEPGELQDVVKNSDLPSSSQ